MTTIVIVESNPKGYVQAAPQFRDVLLQIDPDLTVRVVTPYDTPLAADAFAGADGVIFTGSAVDWNTSSPEAEPLRAAMVAAMAGARPVYGSCNGMQLAASVLGGQVGESASGREIAVARDVRLTAAGADHPMMAGRRSGFSVMCWHRDEVTALPPGAVVLAGNAHSGVQAMAVTGGDVDFWGCQYHPEFDPEVAAGIAERTAQPDTLARDLRAAGTDAVAAARVGMRVEDLEPEQHRTEIRNWLSYVMARAGG